MENRSNKIWTVPNILSLFRIFCTGLFVMAAIFSRWQLSFLLYLIAAFSDLVDGSIARIFKQKTNFGAFIDPMADKILMLAGFILLTSVGVLPSWLLALVITRDIMQAIGYFALRSDGVRVDIRPTIPSKFNTLSQMAVVFCGFIKAARMYGGFDIRWVLIFEGWLPFWMTVTALLTVITGFHYYRLGLGVLRENGQETV